ncbi:MAG: hypothetical protein AAFU79_37085, partial [Myxococcota bacterium]
KEPMRRHLVIRILQTPSGTRVGNRLVDWHDPFWIMWRAWICVMAQTGFRKSESSLPNQASWNRRRISRASVTWRVGGVDCACLTGDQLRALQTGD